VYYAEPQQYGQPAEPAYYAEPQQYAQPAEPAYYAEPQQQYGQPAEPVFYAEPQQPAEPTVTLFYAEPPYTPVPQYTQQQYAPPPVYEQPPDAAGSKKGGKKALLIILVICAVVAAAAVVFVFLILPNLGDKTDYIAAVDLHQPFIRQGYSADYGLVFEKYINSMEYTQSKQGDLGYVDVKGTLVGSGERIVITFSVTADARVTPRSIRVDDARITDTDDVSAFLLNMFEAFDKGLAQVPLGDSPFISAPPPPTDAPPPESPPETPPPETQPPETPPSETPPSETPPSETPPSETPPPETPPPPEPPPPPPPLSAFEVLAGMILETKNPCWLTIFWDNNTITQFERIYYNDDWFMYSRDGDYRAVEPTFWLEDGIFKISFPTTTRVYHLFEDHSGHFGDEKFEWEFDWSY